MFGVFDFWKLYFENCISEFEMVFIFECFEFFVVGMLWVNEVFVVCGILESDFVFSLDVLVDVFNEELLENVVDLFGVYIDVVC